MGVRVDGEDEEFYQKGLALNNFTEHLKKMETSPPKLNPFKLEKCLYAQKDI